MGIKRGTKKMANQSKEPTSASKIAKLTEDVTFRTLSKALRENDAVKVYSLKGSKVSAKTVRSTRELREALDASRPSPIKFKSYSITKKTKKR